METWYIKPTHFEPIELCGLDFTGGYYFFEGTHFIPYLDVDRFFDALRLVISVYAPFAGSVSQDHMIKPGPGIAVGYQELSQPTPTYGPNLEASYQKDLLFPRPSYKLPVDEPLLYLKLTKFSDGQFALGSTISHLLTDVSGHVAFYADLFKIYHGQKPSAPTFSRAPLVQSLIDEFPFPIDHEEDPISGDSVIHHLNITKGERNQLKKHSSDVGNLLRALMVKSFAQIQPTKKITVLLPYDGRFVPGLGVSKQYRGNCTLSRHLSFDIEDVKRETVLDTAKRFKSYGPPSANDARKFISELQSRYINLGLNKSGIVNGTIAHDFKRGCFKINIATPASIASVSKGLIAWSDFVLEGQRLPNSSLVLKDANGGLDVSVILPKDQILDFSSEWSRLVSGLIG